METAEHPVLTTDRLTLRPLEMSDWQDVYAYASDPDVTRFMVWGPNTEPQQTQDFIADALRAAQERPRRVYELAVVLRGDGRLIGGCGLVVTDFDQREGIIGYCFARDHWGRGYATEAARAITGFGVETLGLHRVFTVCQAQNSASARVMEKIGMRREGLCLEERWAKGRWWDVLHYAILDREWEAQNG